MDWIQSIKKCCLVDGLNEFWSWSDGYRFGG